MKIAAKESRGYKLTYKKKSATTDPYLPRGANRKITVCESCHAVYTNKRWCFDAQLYENAIKDAATNVELCPADRKIRDDFPGGVVTLKGDFIQEHKDDLLNLIKNEDERARGFNPLERVMSVRENGSGSIVIATTNEKMAQRIGRAIKKAFHGEVTYRWSHDTKLARVNWERAA